MITVPLSFSIIGYPKKGVYYRIVDNDKFVNDEYSKMDVYFRVLNNEGS